MFSNHFRYLKTQTFSPSKNSFPSLFISILSLFLFSMPSHALTVRELQNKIYDSDLNLRSIQFNYTQETTSRLTDETKKSSGTAYIVKPRKLRIEIKTPEAQTIVTSGKTVYIFTPRFQQVIKESWSKVFTENNPLSGIIGFSDSYKNLVKNYSWKIVGESILNGEETLNVHLASLSDKDKSDMNLWIAKKDYIPRRTELIIGTIKIITTLDTLVQNVSLNKNLFKFVLPKNTEVIEMQ